MNVKKGDSIENASGRRTGSVIVIVLGMIMLVSALLAKFIERTGEEMLLEAKTSDLSVLRSDAYSAMEVTLATLSEFSQIDGGLYQPRQGWSDPLDYADYALPSGSKIRIKFVDETGKVSLASASADVLIGFFKACGLKQTDAEIATDGLLFWTRKDYVPTSTVVSEEAYEYLDPPRVPPKRPMRSFAEMASVIGLQKFVCDEQGRPNEVWQRIAQGGTLYRLHRLNVNSVQSEALQAMGWDNPQIATLRDSLENLSKMNPTGRATMSDLPALDGVIESVFGTQIEVLSIEVSVSAGDARFRLQTVIRIPAKDDSETESPKQELSPLHYPFRILECSENPESAPSGSVDENTL